MCGIAGIFATSGRRIERIDVERMAAMIAHRGPDSEGVYLDGEIGLGHRRLAIIDPSPAGRQPMGEPSGRYTIVYNGEVYNFREIRLELEEMNFSFSTQTDTEVVLRSYQAWGEKCIERFNGMFALAIWDGMARRLFLARDRFGIKPLYYRFEKGRFAFASEIKAFLPLSDFQVRVCPEALHEYFTFQNIFSERTLFDGVKLLPPGSTLCIESGTTSNPQIEKYWDFDFREETIDQREAEEELYRLLEKAVSRQMVSDVSLGSYLSGGVDSGSIAGLASQMKPRLTTFTGGFDLSSASGLELGFDERETSEMLSNHFKTEHYEVVLKSGDMEVVMPELAWHMEDLRLGQNYPNYYVARLASKFVKVVLSGAGGDELFAGYPWRYYRAIDSASKQDYLRRYYSYWQRLVGDEERGECFSPDVLRVIGDHHPFDDFSRVFDGQCFELNTPEEYINHSLYFECKTFLHGFFLVEDKLSMAHSLETRVPFLDNDLVEFAMRVPVRLKLSNLHRTVNVDENEPGNKTVLFNQRTGDGKIILRQAMQRLAPSKVSQLKKQGFSGPDASWFRGESLNYVRQLLLTENARIGEYINAEFVRTKLDEHCSGQVNNRLLIWSFLSFEWWLRKFMP